MTLTVLDPRSVRTLTDRSRLRTVRRCLLAMAASVGLMSFEPAAAASRPLVSSILPAATEAILSDGPAGPTPAWTEFCKHQPQECAVDASEPAVLTLTRTSGSPWASERACEPHDPCGDGSGSLGCGGPLGLSGRWAWGLRGHSAAQAQVSDRGGLSRRALPMTVVIDEQGAGHAVLMVRTDRGDFILDNKRDAVLAWYETGYHYVKREGDDGSGWVWLGGEPVPTATATR